MVNYLNIQSAKELFPLRAKNSSKFTFGKVLNIAGSINYPGAAYLSSVSALRVGAGYIRLACPDCILSNIAKNSPDITFLPLSSTPEGTISQEAITQIKNEIENYDIISIGSGLTKNIETMRFVKYVLSTVNSDQTVVIDADAINAISIMGISELPLNTILTPHLFELSKLINVKADEIYSDRQKYAVETANKYNCIVILKGNGTIITNGREIKINQTGSSALAKAGTGDVLTGIISGFLAQNLFPYNASILGVFLHGLAGDICAKSCTEYGLLASDLISYIPIAIKEILRN